MDLSNFDSIADFLTTQKIDFHLSKGGQELVVNCPYCQKEKKLYINAFTGRWHCFHCVNSGNWDRFLIDLKLSNIKVKLTNEIPESFIPTPFPFEEINEACTRLLKNKTALRWLKQNYGWSEAIISRMKIGLSPDSRIFMYPNFDSNGACFQIKNRTAPWLPNKAFLGSGRKKFYPNI